MPRPRASRSAGLAVEITRTKPPGTSAGGLTAAVTEPLGRFGVRGVGKRRVYTGARRGKRAGRVGCAVRVNCCLAMQDGAPCVPKPTKTPRGRLRNAAPWATIARVTRLRRIAGRHRIFFVTTNLRRHSPPLTGRHWSSAAHYVHGTAVPVASDPIVLTSNRRAWLRL